MAEIRAQYLREVQVIWGQGAPGWDGAPRSESHIRIVNRKGHYLPYTWSVRSRIDLRRDGYRYSPPRR